MRIGNQAWRRQLACAAATVAAGVTLAACGDDQAEKAPARSDAPAKAANTTKYPVTIENCGRKLTFDKAPSRAYVGYHPIAELFISLGLADRAVGRAIFEKNPPILPEQAAAMNSIPVVSETSLPPPREKLLALRPDFLIAYADFDYDGTEGRATLKQLNAAALDVYTVDCAKGGLGPDSSIETTYGALRDLGKIFGVSQRAEKVVKQMEDQVAAVQQKIAGKPPVKVLFYISGTGPISVYGGASTDGRIIRLGGAESVIPSFAGGPLSLEKAAKLPIEAFVITAPQPPREGMKLPDATKEKQFLTKTFPNQQAIKDRRFAITQALYTAYGPRQSQTVEDIARQLYPDAFE